LIKFLKITKILKNNQKNTLNVMTNNTKNNNLEQGHLLIPVAKNGFQIVLNIATELLEKNPEILELIKRDQDRYCKEKKRLRLLDKRYEEKQTKNLFSDEEIQEISQELDIEKVELQTGRKRMQPIIVFLFFLFRGYHGNFCKRKTIDIICDSMTIYNWLTKYGVNKLPGATTILENVNMISNETRERILTAQCKMVLEEELDDFKITIIDSTAVAANTAYPTDVSMLRKYLERAHRTLEMTSEKIIRSPISKTYFDKWFKELNHLVFTLVMNKVKGKKKKRECKNLLKTASKIRNRLLKMHETLTPEFNNILIEFVPSQQTKIEERWNRIKEDLEISLCISEYTKGSIIEGKKYKSVDKKLSISDTNVAFIKKGTMRNCVIGYKSQLALSGNGIITAMQVSEGNTSDKKALIPLLKQDFRRTGVISIIVSTDDGYSWRHNKIWLEEVGTETISMNGINGRRLTSDEDWESEAYKLARAERSVIEGLISTLKLVHDFGKLSRRGVDNARAEMLEKVIAQNFYRTGTLRRRKREEEARAAQNKSRDAA